MPVFSSALEVVGLILAAVALYHLGGGWLLAVIVGVALTGAGLVLGRPVDSDEQVR